MCVTVSAERLTAQREHWLAPTFLDPGADEIRFVIQTWLIRSGGRTILIDTGIGNVRERPTRPSFHHLNAHYLGELAAAGVRPQDVDTVVCTHVHVDHVGWNTLLTDEGEWRPTFPNAQYVISRADFDYYNPANGHRTRAGPQMANVFEDSVAPVHQAGQTVLWEGDHYDIDAQIRIEPAPGHTPGSSVVWLRPGTDRAVFAGDLLHSPLQIVEPDDCPSFAQDVQDTLDFSILHRIRPMIEVLPLDHADDGYRKMLSGAARFRMVLTTH